MADTMDSSNYSSNGEFSRASEADNSRSEPSSASEKEGSPIVEVVPGKRSRKVPARFKDLACTPTASQVVEEFDAMMKDSKLLKKY